MGPTMKDVAAAAGVSLKTVSRVVNEESVSDSKRAAVDEAIRRLGFRRNHGAAMLRRGQSASVGLVLEDSSEPFQAAVTRAIQSSLIEQGYLVFAGSHSGLPDRERTLIDALASRRVDGLIVVPSSQSHDFLRVELRGDVPLVCIDRPALGVAADSVLSDNQGGVALAVRHLTAQGHRRIAMIADLGGVFTANERVQGYRNALAAAQLPFDPGLVFRREPYDVAGIRSAVAHAVAGSEPATAIVTANGSITVAALPALAGAPRPTALVGFDDFALADLLSPPVTVIAQDPARIGRTATELLLRRLGGDRGPAAQLRVPTSLIVRGSGEVAA